MAKKAPTIDPEVELEEEFDEEFEQTAEELEEFAQTTEEQEAFAAAGTVAIPDAPKKKEEPRVTVFLPKVLDADDEGVKVDQYEHVTIANERGETCYKVLRGEYVDVPISVFIVLKQKYPKL